MGMSVSPRRLLLIADSPPFRQTLARLLRVVGHTVWDAETGAAGLAILRQHPLDLVATDRDMPGLTGWDVARLIRATYPQLPVVLLAGGTGSTTRDGRTPAPVDAILWKPFPFAELLGLIGRLTRGDILASVGEVDSPVTGTATGQLYRRMRRSLAPSGR